MIVEGGDDLTIGLPGYTGFIAIAILVAGFYIYDTWISKERIMSSNVEWLQS